jgi:hypothetical protein
VSVEAADAVYNLLEQWRLVDKVVEMRFDTTFVNTRNLVRACVILEKRNWTPAVKDTLSPSHNGDDIVQSFTLCFGPSSSPDIAMLKKFKSVWEAVVKDNFIAIDVKEDAEELLQTVFCRLQSAITKSYCREDYKELIELALVVFGKKPTEIHWNYPGPIH